MLPRDRSSKQRQLMREFEKHTIDDQVHNITTLWCTGSCPTAYVKGWKISPSHFVNRTGNDLARSIIADCGDPSAGMTQHFGSSTRGCRV